MGKKYRKYTFEEKLEAAKMHAEEGIGCTTIAKKFNCGKNRVLLWSNQYKEGGEKALQKKVKRNNNIKQNNSFNSIEEELEYVKAERDILKKHWKY